MYSKEAVITNKLGLHARPASEFIKTTTAFKAKVWIQNLSEESEEVNAKSMVRLLSLAIKQGMKVRITADGEDEQEAVDSLVRLIESGCGEE